MSPARPDVGASIRHNYYMALLARFRAGWGWSDAGARGRARAQVRGGQADRARERRAGGRRGRRHARVAAGAPRAARPAPCARAPFRRPVPHSPCARGLQACGNVAQEALKCVDMQRRKPSNVLICSAGNPQICSGHMTPKRLRNTLSARGPPCMSMLSCLGSRTRARQTMHPVDPTVCRRPFHKSARLRAPHGRRASRSATGAAAATRRCRRTRTPRSSRTSWRARAPRRRSPSAWTCCS